jgi:hypothetical protein
MHMPPAVHPELFLEHMRSLRESGIDIAVMHPQRRGDVVGNIGMGGRCPGLHRLAAILDRRQDLIVDRDGRHGVLGRIARVGDHHRDCFAHIADLIAGEAVLGAHDADGRIGHQVRDAAGAHRFRQVLGGQHGVHARHGERRLPIDGADPGMAVWAAHEAGAERAGKVDVVHEAAAADQQRRVLEPRHPCAEVLGTHPATSLRRPL